MKDVETRFFDAAMRILATNGYAEFKLANVCSEAGASTGSFYYAFPDWTRFCTELVEIWCAQQRRWSSIGSSAGPHSEVLAESVRCWLASDRFAEASMRAWGARDPAVGRALSELDSRRFDGFRTVYLEVLQDGRSATVYAELLVHLMIGYSSLPGRSPDAAGAALIEFVGRTLNSPFGNREPGRKLGGAQEPPASRPPSRAAHEGLKTAGDPAPRDTSAVGVRAESLQYDGGAGVRECGRGG